MNAITHRGNLCHYSVSARLTIEAANVITHVVQDSKVVLNTDNVAACRSSADRCLVTLGDEAAEFINVQEYSKFSSKRWLCYIFIPANHVGGGHTLFDIEERRGLIKHVYICILANRAANSETLELTCLRAYVHIFICARVYMYVTVFTSVYVCVFVCVCVCVCTHHQKEFALRDPEYDRARVLLQSAATYCAHHAPAENFQSKLCNVFMAKFKVVSRRF